MQRRTAKEWLEVINSHEHHAGDGLWLEELVCDVGPHIPEWDLKEVWGWGEWPSREQYFPGVGDEDIGVDNVGIRLDGALVAIQCKARSVGASLSPNDLTTFIHHSADERWSERWVLSNARFNTNLTELNLRSETRALKLVDFVTPVRDLVHEEEMSVREDHHLTEMQDEVVNKVLKEFPRHSEQGHDGWEAGEARGHVVLPCGTGKTRIAYRVSKELAKPHGGIFVILVPSIALVSQIKREFQKLARKDGIEIRTLAVCSDVTAGRTKSKSSAAEESIDLISDPTRDTSLLRSFEVVGDTAVNEAQVKSWLEKHAVDSKDSFLALFSTYQSSHNTAKGLRDLNLKAKLMICDEAHRTAGIKRIPEDGEHIRNFTLCHDGKLFPAEYRLYQTATPKKYTKGTKNSAKYSEDDEGWDIKSMNDVTTFGPQFFRLSYVEAVEKKLLSDYRIVAWGMSEQEAEEAQKIADELNEAAKSDGASDTKWDKNMAMRALTLAAFVAGCVPNVRIRSVIAFCNRVKTSSELAQAIGSKPVQRWLKKYFKRLDIKRTPAKLQVQHVDATYPSAKRNAALHHLGTASEVKPFCITNVGIFGEGTDSPGLSAVAFLNPRKSPVDVIQAVGRAMRKSPEKEFGYILVPVVIPQNRDPENFLRNSGPENGWEELGQILQALRAHDGRIEDDLESLMEFYVPPPPVKSANHIVVVKEPHRQVKVFNLHTKTPTVEQIIAPTGKNDTNTLEQRLRKKPGSLKELKKSKSMIVDTPPKSISVVVQSKDNKTYIKDLTYTIPVHPNESNTNGNWDLSEAVEDAKEFIRKDRSRRKSQMRQVNPRPRRELDRQLELGLKLLHLEENTLAESGIHLNLLEKSGIQGGSRRDANLLRDTVNVVARKLKNKEKEVEEILSHRLGMENENRSSAGNADACTVASVIWLNAAIMHARLEKEKFRQLQTLRPLRECISDISPALGLMEAWNAVLIKDYVPIFKIAFDLLQAVAFRNIEGVSDALRLVVKSATDIADQYANLGMDHAGELFNSVMGNQHSDGAFFTRPIAATMLAELALYAAGERDWLDEKQWDDLRCFDPSCGSGTILVAMLSAMKRRIINAGGNQKLIKRFHKQAVEKLMIGSDINHVALQLAASQMTLGETSVIYDDINLFQMEYGPTNTRHDESSIKSGTIELFMDERLFPLKNELNVSVEEETGEKVNLNDNTNYTNLGDVLSENKIGFVMMNPPFTAWREIGTKFNKEIQSKIRSRLKTIAEEKSLTYPILKGKSTSIAILFEALALHLANTNQAVMGLIVPSTITTAEDLRYIRQVISSTVHIDYVLSSHDPFNINMSWDTSINECIIITSPMEKNYNKPTKFINLHRFPDSLEEVYDILESVIQGVPFNGSSIEWNYKYVKEGDWTPAVFGDCELASEVKEIFDNNKNLGDYLIKNDTSGGGWVPTRFDI